MELIKLPINLGIIVAKQLQNNSNYKPRKNKFGLLSFEFTKEELSQISKLELINPSSDTLDVIKYFTNLEKLIIKSNEVNNVLVNTNSINQNDILNIETLSNLKSLTLINQSQISFLNLNNLINLEELEIVKNNSLEEISNLDKLKKLKNLKIYGNKNLYEIINLQNCILNQDLEELKLDLLHYPEIASCLKKLRAIYDCSFIETISGEKEIEYSPVQVSAFHNKALAITKYISQLCGGKKEKIIGTEKYLAKNIEYDTFGKDTTKRALYKNNHQVGKTYGTNSAYNGIMYGSCVCEGFTRSMQYILKIMKIKTKNVYCVAGANKIKINKNIPNNIELPTDDYHSIIRIELPNPYYCDPCFDSSEWHHGRKNLPFCLLTKEEIEKTHTLSLEEKETNNSLEKIPREYIKKIVDALEKKEQLDMMQQDESNYNSNNKHL